MEKFGQTSFMQTWSSKFGETPPLGHELRERFPETWTRFHALPQSKRYATLPSERQIIRDRASKLASECFSDSQNLWLIVVISENMLNSKIGASAISRYKLKKALTWEDLRCDIHERIPMSFFAEKSDWKNNELDWIIDQIADDKLRAIFFEPYSGNVLAPYDGGFDVLIENPNELMRLEEKYSSWMSERPDRL